MSVRPGKSSPALSGVPPRPLTQRQFDERCAELRRLGASESEISDFKDRVQVKIPPPPALPKPRHGFEKGKSGNPGGRPKELTAVRELARQHTFTALNSLVQISRTGKNETARVQASTAILDRGWGKPVQPLVGDRDWLFPVGEVIEGRAVDEDARQRAIQALEAAFAEARELAPRLTSRLPSEVSEAEQRAASILSAAGEPEGVTLPSRRSGAAQCSRRPGKWTWRRFGQDCRDTPVGPSAQAHEGRVAAPERLRRPRQKDE
jgi:Family of unknown function (DUF5681)